MKKQTSLNLLAAFLLAFASLSNASAQSDGTIDGYEYVDLGLPSGTLWATHNIGAETPQEAGSFFAWGEVEPRESFSWENYKYFIDYVYDPENGAWEAVEDLGDDICGTEYDAARKIWGGAWRLPNETERYELRMYSTSKMVTENGVKGLRVYGPNSHSIFIPAGGSRFEGMPDLVGVRGYIWTGVTAQDKTYTGHLIEPAVSARTLEFDSEQLQSGHCAKSLGMNIRPVINRNEVSAIETTMEDSQPNAIYNLQGQNLSSEPEHGIFIINGKKIIK